MIIDKDTDYLYLAGCLLQRFPSFIKELDNTLLVEGITCSLLPNTADVWAKDYMPVQVREDKYVQFVYNPDYLRRYKKWQKTITDVDSVCPAIGIRTKKSGIVLDGGNVIRAKDKVIVTDKIFRENPTFSRKQLLAELEVLFEVSEIIIIPQDPFDFTGHADGMVRFYNDDTVIINDYKIENSAFRETFCCALQKSGLRTVLLPYDPYGNHNRTSAEGIYINYLQMHGIIVVPAYGLKKDEAVFRQMEELFAGDRILAIRCNDIAREGGVLNCISWNICLPNQRT